jgi:dUTP pyrophosphatase
MKVNIKLSEGASLPKYAKNGDAGLDLIAISKSIINEKDHGFVEYDTGIALELPENHMGLIFPRGSISTTGMILANSVGLSDPNYRGTIKCRFKWIPETKMYEIGDKIAQLVIVPYPTIEFEIVDELSKTERNEKAFGSSGN